MIDLGFYFKLLKRRFPAMAGLFLAAFSIGLVVALRQPNTYSTQATLLVEAPQIPSDMVRGSVDVAAPEQLDLIQQRLLTRANLLDVARTNKVFPNSSQIDPDTIVTAMRQATQIRRSSGRDKATVMTIGFTGATPEVVAGVVNQYVTIVLSTNSSFRTQRAEGTLAFFDQEVQTLSDTLDAQNQKILDFKNANADSLPENLNYRLSRQSLLQDRLSRDERDIAALKDQRAGIERMYQATGQINVPQAQPKSPEETRLADLQSQLTAALSIYSEQNPKVQLLRNQIAAIEAQMAEAAPSLPADAADPAAADPQPTPLDTSLAAMDDQIANLQKEIDSTTAELKALQDTIDKTPANQVALEAMQRELENTQSLYSAAVTRQSQARMGERVELSSKGQQITVIDPPSVPSGPSGPNRAKVAGAGFVAGLALAGGLFMLLEFLNQSIRRASDIKSALDVTPLASIPLFETAASRRWRRIRQLLLLVIVLVAVPAMLWAVDTYYMPLDELFRKVASRLL